MNLLLILNTLLFTLLLSCSDQHFSSITHTAHSDSRETQRNTENQNKIESTDIGNGAQEPEEMIGSGRFQLACMPVNADQYSCKVSVNSFVDGEVRDIDWQVNCPVNEIGHANGSSFEVLLTLSPECSDDWELNVALVLANGQSTDLVLNGEAISDASPTAEVLGESTVDTPAPEAGELGDMIPMDNLLRDIDGGIDLSFDLETLDYDCDDKGKGKDKDKEKSREKEVDDCSEYVENYDDKAGRNGVDLLNPSPKLADHDVEIESIKISLVDDFCIVVVNALYSADAHIYLNNNIAKASELPSEYVKDCQKYNLQQNDTATHLTRLQLSFPVGVDPASGGIAQFGDEDEEEKYADDRRLIIRLVDPEKGEALKDIAVFHSP